MFAVKALVIGRGLVSLDGKLLVNVGVKQRLLLKEQVEE